MRHSTTPGLGGLFCNTLFLSECSFRHSELFELANFENTYVGAVGNFSDAALTEARFRGSEVKKPMGVLVFERTHFIRSADFDDRVFDWPPRFTDAKFEKPPSFLRSSLHPRTDFRGTDFGSVDDPWAETSFRVLKNHMAGHQNHHMELFFFAKELAAREAQLKRRSLHRLLFAAYRCLSDHGQSVLRPLCALLAVLALSFSLYVLLIETPRIIDCVTQQERCELKRERLSAYTSLTLSQSLPFGAMFGSNAPSVVRELFGKDQPIPTRVLAVGVLQAIASVVCFFLIGLGLRNMFRMK